MKLVDPRFADLKPRIDKMIAPLCPAGYRTVIVVIEPTDIHLMADLPDPQLRQLLAGLLRQLDEVLVGSGGGSPATPPVTH